MSSPALLLWLLDKLQLVWLGGCVLGSGITTGSVTHSEALGMVGCTTSALGAMHKNKIINLNYIIQTVLS
jgi:hypothetical protein